MHNENTTATETTSTDPEQMIYDVTIFCNDGTERTINSVPLTSVKGMLEITTYGGRFFTLTALNGDILVVCLSTVRAVAAEIAKNPAA